MKNKILFLIVMAGLTSSVSRADYQTQINQCAASDARCVGQVLLQALQNGGGTSHSEEMMTVEFYYSDSCSQNLLAAVRFGEDTTVNKQRCQRAYKNMQATIPNGRYDVWGWKINGGPCVNINDTDFLTACAKFE